jgi:hypothetical protein
MNETSNIVALRQPTISTIPLTNILRAGARQLLAQAVEIEVETFLATMKDLKLADGRAHVVRHGYGPARTIATGIGRSRSRGRGFGTAGPLVTASGSASVRRSCHCGRGRRLKGTNQLPKVIAGVV